MTQRIAYITLFAVLVVTITNAQPKRGDTDIRLKLAQSYERNGDFENAVKLYEEVFAKDSSNNIIAEALGRDYLQTKQYDKAVVLLQWRLRRNPNDIPLLSELGKTYLRASDEKKATETWDKAVAVDPKNENTYRIISNAIVESRLFERAIALYQRARTSCNNPKLFTIDLAYMYSIILDFTNATREYVGLVRETPQQLAYAQGRMASYTGRAEGLSAATLVVEQAVKTEPNNITLLQLFAWLYMEGKKFDQAYDVYKMLDEKEKASGRELYTFAERALKEKAYPTASKAFLDVITKYPQFNQQMQAKFGYARTLEEASAERDTLKLFGEFNPFSVSQKQADASSPSFTAAMNAYRQCVDAYPNTEIAARSLLRIATIMYEQFFNLNDARTMLETIAQKYPAYAAILMDANILLGDVYLTQNNLEKAEAAYNSLKSYRFILKNHYARSAFKIAELNYFRGQFQQTLDQLKELTKDASANTTNDALELQLLIQENQKPDDAALKEYAKAELLVRQRKLSEALTIFETITKKYSQSPLADESLMNMGDVLTRMKRYDDAIKAYNQLVQQFSESILLDRTTMKIGEVQQFGLRDTPHAIESYKSLLEKFPSSIFASEVRKRIRELRGDNL